jgi:hypothetical protein
MGFEIYENILEHVKGYDVDFDLAKKTITKKTIGDYSLDILDDLANQFNDLKGIIEQVCVIRGKLREEHDLKRGMIEQIIIYDQDNVQNDQKANLFLKKITFENKEYVLIKREVLTSEIIKIENLLNKTGLSKRVEIVDSRLEEEWYKTNTAPEPVRKFLKRNQEQLNLIHFAQYYGSYSVLRMDYSVKIVDPAIFEDILEFFYIKNFKTIIIKTQENNLYISSLNKKKQKLLYALNLKSVFRDLTYKNILSYFEK